MTNLDPKKTNAPEATELHDEELGQVTGGCDSLEAPTEQCVCIYCGAELEDYLIPCAVCGKTTSPVGAAELV